MSQGYENVLIWSHFKPICTKMFCGIFTQSFDAFWGHSNILKINCNAVSTTASSIKTSSHERGDLTYPCWDRFSFRFMSWLPDYVLSYNTMESCSYFCHFKIWSIIFLGRFGSAGYLKFLALIRIIKVNNYFHNQY